MCLFTFWFNLCDFLMCILHFHSLFSVGCQNASQGGLTCSFLMCLLHFSWVTRHWLMRLFTFSFNSSGILMCLLHFYSLFSGGCQSALQGGLTCNFLMCLLHFSCVIRHFLVCLLHFFWHLQASFWEPIGLSWGLLFGMLEGPVELLGHPLGPKWSQKHQDEGLKSDLGSSRGGQGGSEAFNGSTLGRCSSLVVCCFVFWPVFL